MSPFIYLVIAILSWLVAIAWYLADPGFEPLLAFLAGVASLLQFIREREDRGTRLRDVFMGSGEFIGRDKIVKGDEVHGDKVVNLSPDHFTPRQRRIREGLITRVRTVWVEGILEHGIHQVARLELGLELRPDAVSRPWVLEYEKPGLPEKSPQELPPDTNIHDVWQQTGGSLLILGAPGSGKTFTLVELAEKLLDEAEQDESGLVPLIFNLSSWGQEKGPLFDWLVREMHLVYGVAVKFSPEWLAEMPYALFLDGLDEVAADEREACVEAIHAFQAEYGPVPLAVCSRTQEYEELAEQLQMEGAIHVRPLSEKQVDEYLAAGGKKLAAAREAVQTDVLFRELARTPLILNVIALAYWSRPIGELTSRTAVERRQELFDAYVARMLKRKGKLSVGERRQILARLAYLARQMKKRELSLFYVERLQPDWLSSSLSRLFHSFGLAVWSLAIGLFVAVAILGIYIQRWRANWRAEWLEKSLNARFSEGLAEALVRLLSWTDRFWIDRFWTDETIQLMPGFYAFFVLFAIFLWFIFGLGNHKAVDVLMFSWRRGISGLVYGLQHKLAKVLVFGLISGTLVGLIYRIPAAGIAIGVYSVLLGWLVIGLQDAFVTQELQSYSTINQGLRLALANSIRGALLSAVFYGIIGGLFFGLTLGVIGSLIEGPRAILILGANGAITLGMLGAVAGFIKGGGTAMIHHAVLRGLFVISGRLPLFLVTFLEKMRRRVLLRRVGGGYMFIHRMLLEYFAELDVETE